MQILTQQFCGGPEILRIKEAPGEASDAGLRSVNPTSRSKVLNSL